MLKRAFEGKTKAVDPEAYITKLNKRKTIEQLSVFILVFGTLVSPQFVSAQETGQRTGNIGEAAVYSSVRLGVLSTDNAFRASENTVESSGFRIAPTASVVADRRGLRFTAAYNGDFASFSEAELDYNDHQLTGSVGAILGARKQLSATTKLTFRHEELGTGLTRGTANNGDEQVEATDVSVDANYLYGAQTAKFNITGGLLLQNVAFQNRSDLTEGRDFTKIRPYGRLSYRLSQDTRALVELAVSDFGFGNESFDRSVIELLTGLSFQGSGKTLGQLKVGVASNNYSDSRVEDTTVFVADIGLNFSPSSASRIEVNFKRQINNEEGIDFSNGATQTINDAALLRWTKKWSGFSKSVAYVSFESQNRDCPTSGTQSAEGGLEISILPRRWIEIGAGISSRNVTADDCGDAVGNDLEYELNEILAFVRIFP